MKRKVYRLHVVASNAKSDSVAVSLTITLEDVEELLIEDFKRVLEQKCGITPSAFDSAFNTQSGHYDGDINCVNKELDDAELRTFKLLKSISHGLNLSGNNIDSLDILSNLTAVSETLNLSNNNLETLEGLENLQSVGRTLRLGHNRLTNLNGLEGLETVFEIRLGNKETLHDISALHNLHPKYELGLIYVNSQGYDKKVDKDSDFCQAKWEIFDINNKDIWNDKSLICDKQISYTPPLAERFRSMLSNNRCNYRIFGEGSIHRAIYFYTNAFIEYNNGTLGFDGHIDCSNKNLVDENLSMFRYLGGVSGLKLNNNQIETTQMLQNLSYVGTLDLSFNHLNNVDGLHKLSYVRGALNLNDNQLENINGLSSLNQVTRDIHLENNPLLWNIKGLSHLQWVYESGGIRKYIYTDLLRQYSQLPEASSTFCQSTHFGVFNSSENRSYSNSMLCEGRDLPPDPAVENFVSTLTQKCGMDEYEVRTHFNPLNGVYDGNLSCEYVNLALSDIFTFIILKGVHGDLSFKGTQFIDSDLFLAQFFSHLEEIRGSIDLSGTNLKNLDILSGLRHIEGRDIFLSNMTELEDISVLEYLSAEENITIYLDKDISFANKFPRNSSFCGSSWSIQTINGVQLSKSLLCSPLFSNDKISLLKDIMIEKCYIYDAEAFERDYDAFDAIYNDGIDCANLEENELSDFDALKTVNGHLSIGLSQAEYFSFYGFDTLRFIHGSLYIYGNNLLSMGGFSSLEKIDGDLYMNSMNVSLVDAFGKLKYIGGDMLLDGNSFYDVAFLQALRYVGGNIDISYNDNLMDIEGLSEVKGVEGKRLIIDNKEYTPKALMGSQFCQTGWVVSDGFNLLGMSYVCE